MLHDEQEIGEMEANLVGDLRAVTIRVFKYHHGGLKLDLFGAQTQQREEKQTIYSKPEGPKGFLRILETLSLIFPISQGQFLKY